MDEILETDDDTLDLSWIEEESKLLQSTPMQKTPMQTIRLQCIYVSHTKDIILQTNHTCVLSVVDAK